MNTPLFVPTLANVDLARHALAATLRAGSRALARAALALSNAPPRSVPAPSTPRYEFYAEAGAPEGALYADGQLVALLPGVQRL